MKVYGSPILLDRYQKYKHWLSRNYIPEPEDNHAYRQAPGLDPNYVAYASVPTKPLDEVEVQGAQELMKVVPRDVAEKQYREYIHRVLTAQFENLTN